MRIGLVRYLNARPLDYAFRVRPDRYAGVECLPETPARLLQMLLSGQVDTALISSVECYRHRDALAWCDRVGVASDREVQSLLYIRRREDPLTESVRRIFMDEGSRTTVALTKLLYLKRFGEIPECVTLPPEEIPERLDSGTAGLLIGDAALKMFRSPGPFHFRDLVSWWNEETGLPFVAALWAYPREKASLFPDSFFTEALDTGLTRMEDILKENGPQYRDYLTHALHYNLNEADRQALEVFSSQLQERGLL